MAKPIEFQPIAHGVKENLERRLAAAPVEHADAVLAGYDLLEKLYRSGVLDIMRGALGAGDELVKNAVSMFTRPESLRGLRNLVGLSRLLGSIDPEIWRNVEAVLPNSDEKGARGEPPSLLALLRQMNSVENRRALSVLSGVLGAVGRGLESRGG